MGQEKVGGVGGAGVSLRPLTWSAGQHLAENRGASMCQWVHGIHIGLSVKKCLDRQRWCGVGVCVKGMD